MSDTLEKIAITPVICLINVRENKDKHTVTKMFLRRTVMPVTQKPRKSPLEMKNILIFLLLQPLLQLILISDSLANYQAEHTSVGIVTFNHNLNITLF